MSRLLNNILSAYIKETYSFYRKQLNKDDVSINKVIQYSLKKNEFIILRDLVNEEFPHHKDKINKCYLL